MGGVRFGVSQSWESLLPAVLEGAPRGDRLPRSGDELKLTPPRVRLPTGTADASLAGAPLGEAVMSFLAALVSRCGTKH